MADREEADREEASTEKRAQLMPCPSVYLVCKRSGANIMSRANDLSGGCEEPDAHENQLCRSGSYLRNVLGPVSSEIIEKLMGTEDIIVGDFWFI